MNHKQNDNVLKELKAEMLLNKTWKYKINWIQHVNSMFVRLSMCKPLRQMGKRTDIRPLVLNLCGRSRRADSFIPALLYTVNMKTMGGPQSQSGYSEEKKNLFPLPGIEPETTQPIAWSLH
jgi:hypothetical protein